MTHESHASPNHQDISRLSGAGGGRWLMPAIALCFFASGIAGLIYEVVWSRYLALFVGSSGEAHVIILSTYMGGLALGAWLFGRRADHSRSPLKLYAVLEVGIGALGLAYPLAFEPIRGVFYATVRGLGLGPVGLHSAEVLAAVLTLLAPTALMGGTLPALGRFLVRDSESVGQRIATLYYLNSMGAVAGSLLAGFWLLHAAGLELSMTIAAALNFLAGGVAWLMARALGEAESAAADPGEAAAEAPRATDGTLAAKAGGWTPARIALVVIGISGLASMIYQVAWIRLLTLALGSSSFSFALMLAAFISGLTLGSFLLARKRSEGGYFAILGWTEAGIGASALLCLFFYAELPLMLNHLQMSIVPSEHTFGAWQFMRFLLCFLVMILPTIFMGATVPAASRVVVDAVGRVGRKVGDVFAVNTVGTLIGASLAGFVFLPQLGIRRTIELAIAINMVLGAWVLLADARAAGGFGNWRLRRWATGGAVGFVALVIAYVVGVPQWDVRVLTSAPYRMRGRIEDSASLKRSVSGLDVLYHRDGVDATVTVVREKGAAVEKARLAILINGKPDASTSGDMATQLLVGHLPMLIHPNPQDVLVVGLGSGMTAGATTHYGAKSVQCVELIPEVVEAAAYFKDYTNDITRNPAAKIILQDAKTFMQVTQDRYDVIISEPTNPWIAGVANLFSVEYFREARAHLKPGGLFVQWVQCYELLDNTMYSTFSTLHEVFPYSAMFNPVGSDLVIVSSAEPFSPDFALMEQRLAIPTVKRDLGRVQMHGLLPVLSTQVVAKNLTANPLMDGFGINSDLFPILEYEANKGFFIGSSAKGIRSLDQRRLAPGRSRLWIHDYVPTTPLGDAEFGAYAEFLRGMGSMYPGARDAWIALWLKAHPESQGARWASIAAEPESYSDALARIEADDSLTSNPTAAQLRMRIRLQNYERRRTYASLPDSAPLLRAVELAERLKAEPLWKCLRVRGDLAWDAGRPAEAIESYIKALKDLVALPSYPTQLEDVADLWLRVAEAAIDAKQFDAAQAALARISPASLASEVRALELRRIRCRLAAYAEPVVTRQ